MRSLTIIIVLLLLSSVSFAGKYRGAACRARVETEIEYKSELNQILLIDFLIHKYEVI